MSRFAVADSFFPTNHKTRVSIPVLLVFITQLVRIDDQRFVIDPIFRGSLIYWLRKSHFCGSPYEQGPCPEFFLPAPKLQVSILYNSTVIITLMHILAFGMASFRYVSYASQFFWFA